MPGDEERVKPKQYGLLKGQIESSEDFDAPLEFREGGSYVDVPTDQSARDDLPEAEIWALIMQTLGEGPEVESWLDTPMPFLAGETPREAIREVRGRKVLREAVLAIQHGFPA